MNSDILKNAILEHFRFKRQYIFCATEVNTGSEIADILLSNEKEVIEIEIKISYSDFLADFRKKSKYRSTEFFFKANKLYFCVPSELKGKCLKYIIENNLPYGLYSFNGELNLNRRAKKIKELSEREILKINKFITQRMGSELITLRKEKVNRKWDTKRENS